MAVHLTRIYTRTGDDGTTALGDFSRVRKTDVRLAAYADTDEANAAIGVAVTVGGLAEDVLGPLRQVQNDLFDVGADLCTPDRAAIPQYPPLRVTEEYVTRLEGWCDAFNADLPKLASFILPGGTPGRGLPARRPHGHAAGRAVGVGAAGGRSRAHQPADGALPQPALGPAVHPRPGGEPGRRRAVAPGGQAVSRGTRPRTPRGSPPGRGAPTPATTGSR